MSYRHQTGFAPRTILLASAFAILVLRWVGSETPLPWLWSAWFLAALGCEALRLRAKNAYDVEAYANVAHVYTVVYGGLLGAAAALSAAILSRWLLGRSGDQRCCERSIRISAALVVVWGVGVALGSPAPGSWTFSLLVLAATAGYYGVLVAPGFVMARRNPQNASEYLYGKFSTAALMLISIILVVAYGVMESAGIALCLIPLLLVREAAMRFRNLEDTRDLALRAGRLSARGHVAGVFAHELNNFLAAVSGRSQLLSMRRMQRADGPEDGDHSVVEMVREGALSLGELAKTMMEASQEEAEPTAFQVAGRVEQAVDVLRPQPKYRDVLFRVESRGGPDVYMDEAQLHHLVRTLVDRAATAEAAQEETPDVYISSEGEGDGVKIIVARRAGSEKPSTKTHPHSALIPRKDRELVTISRILERIDGRIELLEDDQKRPAYKVFLKAAA